MISIFRHCDKADVLFRLEDFLQTMGHETKSFKEPFDGLNAFCKGKYSLILVNGILDTTKRKALPSSVQIKEPTAIACYFIQQMREDDNRVPIVVFHQGSNLLPKEGSACYTKAGATKCVDLTGKTIDALADAIDAYLE
jgi:hypothetical protein